jgi:pimeloyl-ACP methyl ester carboxylesterase
MPRHRTIALAVLVAGTLVLGACQRDLPPLASRDGSIQLAGGDRLFYRMLGAGPDTVMVVPGGPALGSQYLESALGDLGRSHVLVFYDPRGRGRSPVAQFPDSFSLAQDARDLAVLHDSLHLGAVSVIGHQWGAGVVLRFALEQPAAVTRVVLLSPMAHRQDFIFELSLLPNDSAALARHVTARVAGVDSLDPAGYCRDFWGFAFSPVEETAPAVVTALAPDICADPPERLRQREAMQRQFYLGMPGWNWVDSIPALKAPTLVLTGDAVPALVAGGKAWAGRLPDGRLLITHGSALFPWVDDSSAVVDALATFFGGGWPAAATPIATPPDTLLHS